MFVEFHTSKGALFVCLAKILFLTENKTGCRIFLDDGTQFDCVESYDSVTSHIRLLGIND